MCRLHGAVASSASSQIAFNGRCGLLLGFLPNREHSNLLPCDQIVTKSKLLDFACGAYVPPSHSSVLYLAVQFAKPDTEVL